MGKAAALLLLGALILSGCASMTHYDEWVQGEEEARKSELAEFEELRSTYPYLFAFNSPEELYEAAESGQIKKGGVYYVAGDGAGEHETYSLAGELGNYERLGLCVRVRNGGEGFAEIFFGGRGEGEELLLRSAGDDEYYIPEMTWTLIEVVREGEGTTIYVDGEPRISEEFPFHAPNFFCFGSAAVEVDYVVYR